MSDVQIPEHLIDLQRQVDAADREIEDIGAAMRPPAEAIANDGYTADKLAPLDAARARRDELRLRLIKERAKYEDVLGGKLRAFEAVLKAARAQQ